MSAEGFAAVPTWMIRDESVSLYAVSVYAALASRAGLRVNVPSRETLAREARCSVRRLASALNELEALGVLRRERRVDSRGRASSNYVLISGGASTSEVRASGASTSEVRASGALGEGTRVHSIPLYKVDSSEVDITPISPTPTSASEDDFELFWATYPAGRKKSKTEARKAFVKACARVGVDVVLDGVRRYAGDPNLPEPQFRPNPVVWLNQSRWESEPEPQRSPRGRASVLDVGRAADELLQARERRAVAS